jgi:hypothetical protein
MEVLLLAACAWLAHTAGAQSEQAKMGLSPAQRDILRERTRHEKAVQKIADKHGVTPPAERGPGPLSPWKDAPASERGPALTLPEAFRSGYRGHTRIERVAPHGAPRRRLGRARRGVGRGHWQGRAARVPQAPTSPGRTRPGADPRSAAPSPSADDAAHPG